MAYLVAQLLGKDATTYEPDGVSELLAAHETATGNSHDSFSELDVGLFNAACQ